MMTPQEFSTRIKKRHPQYQNMDDMELARRLVDKYPQYKSQVVFGDEQVPQSTPEIPTTDATAPEFPGLGEGISRAVKGAGKELKGFGQIALAAGGLAGRGIAAGIKSPFERFSVEFTQEHKNDLKDFKAKADEAMLAVPEVAEELVSDFAKTFGIASDPESDAQVPIKFDKQALIDKWLDHPIEATLDAFFVGGIATKIAKGALSAGSRAVAQKQVKQILNKKDIAAAEFAKIAGTAPAAKMEKLYQHADAIDDFTIKQLNSESFGEGVGKLFIDDLRRLKNREQIKLDGAIKKIKGVAVDKSLINKSIGEDLLEAGLAKQTKGGVEILPILDTPKITRELKALGQTDTLTAGAMKKHLNTIDKITNFRATDEVSEALKIIRRGYRQELRRLSPKYDDLALSVSKKMDLLDESVRKIEKAGAGERIGMRILGTDEEQKLFNEILSSHPDKFAGKVQASMKARSAWVSWNKFFKVSDHSIGRVPIVPGAINVDPGTVLTPIKKRLSKAQVKMKRLGLQPPKTKTKKRLLRTGLEFQEKEQE